MDAGLGVGTALHTNRLARALPGTCVGLCALAANWKAAEMSNTSIAFNRLKPFKVQAEFPSKISFDHILAFCDGVNDLRHLSFGEVLRTNARIDLRALEDLSGIDWANAVDVAKRYVDPLLTGDFNTNNTCHMSWRLYLTLPLFVTSVGADHSDHATTTNNLAVLTKSFNGCSDFHIK